MLFLPFLTTSNTWLNREHQNAKKILIYDVYFVKGYNIFQLFY